MPYIPQLYPAILSDIDDNDVIVGEDIKGSGKTFKYSFKVLKEYFGANGGTGVISIITKNDNKLVGDVLLTTGDITISSDFNFVTDADLDSLDRFEIVNDVLNILDENGVVVQSLANNMVTLEQALTLNSVAAGDITMESLVIDSSTGEIKRFPVGGNTLPRYQARVSFDHGDDLTGEIGIYNKSFATITAAVIACRAAVVTTPSLAGLHVIDVEQGSYIDEVDLVFSGLLNLNSGVSVTGLSGTTTFDVTDTAFSGLQNQTFSIQGLGADLVNVTFDHPDQTERHTIDIKVDFIQWESAIIASEFILQAEYFEVTNNGTFYLVDSINIFINRVRVGAGIDVKPFIIRPATASGTLYNNASSVYLRDVEVEDTGRIYVTTFTDGDVHEVHNINVTMDSGKGDIVMMGNTTNWRNFQGDLTLNYDYKLLHENPINSDTSSSKFDVGGNTVLNIKAIVTNTDYLQRGLIIGGHDNAIIYADVTLVSFTSKKTLYLSCFGSTIMTVNGTVDIMTSANLESACYVYAPNEAPYDEVNNDSNLYFENLTLRNNSSSHSGWVIQSWNGANHIINILGSFTHSGFSDTVTQGGGMIFNYAAADPANAEVTKELSVATDAQTVFPAMYKLIDDRLRVTMNGLLLDDDDYSITSANLTLGLAAVLDDEITFTHSNAVPISYEMTEWAQTGPVSASSVVLDPISFASAPTDPTINAVLIGPDIGGDGVLYDGIPIAFDPTAYLGYSIVQDAGNRVQLMSVRFSARVRDAGDTPVTIRVSVSNDSFVSQWDSTDYVFSTTSYVTKEWFLSGRLFSPDKNHSGGIQVRVQIFTDGLNIDQGIYFNNFKLKGYHKLI